MNVETLSTAGAALAAFAAVWTVVGVVRAVSLRRGILDVPNERSLHERPVPRGGGIAIVAIVVIAIGSSSSARALFGGHGVALIVIGLVSLAGVSLYDDLRTANIAVRLTVQMGAAVFALTAINAAGHMRGVQGPEHPLLTNAIAAVWIVGFTNVYNFMDGIDGLAGLQAVIAGLGWAIISLGAGVPLLGALGLLIAAADAGFLAHNWPPARIFMGDVGSTGLGYLFALMVIYAGWSESTLGLAGILLVWPFIFDGGFTILRRLRHRQNVFVAHRTHLYQRLVLSGWPHKRVSSLYGFLAIVGVVCAVLVSRGGSLGAGITTLTLIGAATMLLITVSRSESAASNCLAGECSR